jgi:hypothetical protein
MEVGKGTYFEKATGGLGRCCEGRATVMTEHCS